ncbi:MAG: hypothetical protein QM760_23415 [Nibricoccus sp.]
MRLIAFLAAWLAPLIGFSTELRVAGSDLLGADFDAALTTFAKKQNVSLTTTFAGSRAALEELKAGTVDVALVAFAPDETPPGPPFVVQPLVYRIAVVVVPDRIAVTQISFNQLDGFFGANGPAGFSLWRDIGLAGETAQLTVTTHVLARKGDELSIDLFEHSALRVPKLKSSVERHDEFAALNGRLSAEAGGLAVLSYVPAAGTGLRALLVSKGDRDPAFGPTPENIHTGDYPLRLPVYVIYRSENTASLKPLLAFLWSDEAARSLRKDAALTPVPVSGRPRVH